MQDENISQNEEYVNPVFIQKEYEDSSPTTNEDVHNKQLSNGTYPIKESENSLYYSLEDSPPWYLTILLGIQHFLTMVGATITIPFIITPALCIAESNPVRTTFIATIIFTSGLATILQSTFGIRLPIVQGGTFSYLIPTLALLETRFPSCDTLDYSKMSEEEQEQEYLIRIREVTGCIAVASIFQVLIGMTGLIGVCLNYISPLTIVPTISLIGLALFDIAAQKASTDWLISSMTIGFLILFSQFLPEVNFPIPKFSKPKGFHMTGFPLFKLFPVLLSIILSWMICALATVTNAFGENSASRTDRQMPILYGSPWIYIPYPFQWGLPTVSLGGVLGILAGVIVSMIESIGDYYACARLSGAPPPPIHAINRGIFVEGIGCILAGILGTGNGTTSYSENVGAIRITMVGSRRVIQVAGIAMMVCAILGKFCALFVTVPDPVIGGMFIVLFSMITAVGLSNLQMVDLNSSRNLFILGFSIFLGLALPSWIKTQKDAVNTGILKLDQIITILLSTSMFVGGITALILDNAIPGTQKERGMERWNQQMGIVSGNDDSVTRSPYDLPFGMEAIRRMNWCARVPVSPTFTHCLSDKQRRIISNFVNNRVKAPFNKIFRRKNV